MITNLGPFELYEPIGRGGMARVWRGKHIGRNVPVAIKIMTASLAQKPRFRIAFRREVRAVARLKHPGIVVVFDCGEISTEAARQSQGSIVEGSPYLAMELGGGTLRNIQDLPLSFRQQRTLLIRALDALAYAHARGVIHRDLKPANLLVFTDDDGPRLKLADFGLAHALDDAHQPRSRGRISGTPRFIAPEQITGQWRDQGPWTDLYALGCIAYWLSCGHPPFDGDETDQILRGHLHDPIPPLQLGESMPNDYAQWVRKLLAKDPKQRFQRAADAAFALRRIDGKDRPLDRAITVPLELDDDRDDKTIQEITEGHDETVILPELQASMTPQSSGDQVFERAPIPATWRRDQTHHLPDEVTGAGLGLYGLRLVPMVDRDEERDTIWSALRRVHDERESEAVLLRGAAGIGKSRLAQWISERAHEVSAATVLKATHGPMHAPGDGLSNMLASHLRCEGLARSEILSRIKAVFTDCEEARFDALAITEIIAQTATSDDDSSTRRVRFSTPAERFAVMGRLLDRLGGDRPIMIWLDDVQWSRHALQFVEYLLSRNQPCAPVLVVMTADDEDLHRRDEEAEALIHLGSRADTQTLSLKPLADKDHLAIVRGLLRLEDSLAEEVARRTSGNPLFAIQLVGDWVERGLLVSSAEGYHLRGQQTAPLPDDIHHLLVRRLELIFDAYEQPDRQQVRIALELAAALGHSIDIDEWRALCRQRNLSPPMAAVDALIAAGLAHREHRGWSFAHDAMRESLQRLATEEERWKSHHRACAQMLREYDEIEAENLDLRVARHLWQAEALEDVLQPLLRAAKQARSACAIQRAHNLLDHRTSALDDLGVERRDRRRVTGWICRAHLYQSEGDHQLARDVLHRSREITADAGWTDLMGEIRYVMATVLRATGEFSQTIDHLSQAREDYRRHGDWTGVAKCNHSLGAAFQVIGEYEASEASFREGLTHFENLEDLRGIALCHQGLGVLLTRENKFDEAQSNHETALAYFEQSGDRLGVSNTLNSMGELYRFRGDFRRAEDYYRRSVATRKRLGTKYYFASHFNLAQSLLLQGQYQKARTELHRIMEERISADQKSHMGLIHTALLPCCAHLAQWAQWDNHFEQSMEFLETTALVDKDVAVLLELSAHLAGESGEFERATPVARAAAQQWRAVGEQKRATEVESKWIP